MAIALRSLFLSAALLSFPAFSWAEAWQMAQNADSSLYRKIFERSSTFRCPSPQKDQTANLAKNYELIQGNSPWWLIKSPCGDGRNVCPLLLYIQNNIPRCTLRFVEPIDSHRRQELWTRVPQAYTGDCLTRFQNLSTEPIAWGRDYPLFLSNLPSSSSDGKDEKEELWWVARKHEDNSTQEVSRLVDSLKSYTVLLLSGITYRPQSESIPSQHFGALKNWLQAQGIPYKHVDTLFNFPPYENQNRIEQVFESAAPNERFIVITHSKGGLDFLSFLLNNPALWKNGEGKIRAWVPLQIPFWGSTLAGKINDNSILSLLADWNEAAKDLSPDFTAMLSPERAFHSWCTPEQEPREPIDRLFCSDLPILNVRTWTERTDYFRERDKKPFQDIFDLYEAEPSDGYVWYPSMNIPCGDYISLRGFHHWDFVKLGNKPYYDPVPFFQALLLTMMSDTP